MLASAKLSCHPPFFPVPSHQLLANDTVLSHLFDFTFANAMTPSETANKALNETLANVESLIRRCIKLREGDPEALSLSDAIARRVANDLKLHGENATSFSPKLLSCAAVVRQYSKGGAFEIPPDWSFVMEDDPRIKNHPRFQKTAGYRPPSPADDTAAFTSAAPELLSPPAPAATIQAVTPAPLSPSLAPLTPIPPSPAPMAPTRGKYNLFVPGIQNKVKWATQSNKRKAEDSDAAADAMDKPGHPLVSRKPPQKRVKKTENTPTGTGGVDECLEDIKETSAGDHQTEAKPNDGVETDDDRGFWDVATRPADWGLDSAIATAPEHSVRHHAQKCDRCAKMGVQCLVLLDKKGGCTRLACARCDEMRTACAIDGIGVRARMQARAKVKAEEEAANPTTRSKSRAPKSRVMNKRRCNTVKAECIETPPMDAAVAHAAPRPMHGSGVVGSTAAIPHPASNIASDPDPTNRDILQGILDLGKKFDLLATNERVDALENKVDSVEDALTQRLAALERRLNASDVQWRATSSSIGHLTNTLREHMDDAMPHHPRQSAMTHSPPQQPNVELPACLNDTGHEEDGTSIIGRAHAWDHSTATGEQGDPGTSHPALADAPETPRQSSIASSRLSSPPSAILKE
ncbi:hypothetical protein BDR07DRAFT_1494624 [Suillus spraguei]|nr:hypothetical protein BDR07DRAFT_1494624 [Suillus spraguei]